MRKLMLGAIIGLIVLVAIDMWLTSIGLSSGLRELNSWVSPLSPWVIVLTVIWLIGLGIILYRASHSKLKWLRMSSYVVAFSLLAMYLATVVNNTVAILSS